MKTFCGIIGFSLSVWLIVDGFLWIFENDAATSTQIELISKIYVKEFPQLKSNVIKFLNDGVITKNEYYEIVDEYEK